MARADGDNYSKNYREMNHISMKLPVIPRDLLTSFSSEIKFKEKESDEKSEGIELSLGLSLNGHFGIDPKKKRGGNAFGLGLTRSSSIPEFLNQPMSLREEDEKTKKVCLDYVPPPSIMRTCSLPVETEEECRKRKELQSLRRMEAKRKRTEKQRNLKALKDGCVENGKKLVDSVNGGCKLERMGNLTSFGGKGGEFKCGEGLVLPPQPLLHGSFGSQGSGSSGISESDSQKEQGANKSAESRSPASVHSLREGEQTPSPIPLPGDPSKLRALANGRTFSGFGLTGKGGKEAVRNVLEDMPCVSTTGDGPNGKRIEGFLYRYRKGEEVRIVCVCHGSFLTPAEFVKHAGGGDVQNPLKHIVVSPSSLL